MHRAKSPSHNFTTFIIVGLELLRVCDGGLNARLIAPILAAAASQSKPRRRLRLASVTQCFGRHRK